MIEKRKRTQSPQENCSSDEQVDLNDKKGRSTSVVTLTLSLFVLSLILIYFGKIEMRKPFLNPSANTPTVVDVQLNLRLRNDHNLVDSNRPTIALKNMQQNEANVEKPIHDNAEVKVSLELLQIEVAQQIDKLSKMKREQQMVMETSEEAQREILVLQKQLQTLIPLQYGPGPYRLEMTLRFPDSMLTDPSLPAEETVRIDMAPIDLVPYSVYFFLGVVDEWKGGAFHRNAGHVLQAQVRSQRGGLAFQEYSALYPHKQYTLGYAGRPGGPAFYISTMDNTQNHGPASQGSNSEADSCFGRLADEESIRVVKRMQRQPGGAKGSGFMLDSANNIKITSLKLVR